MATFDLAQTTLKTPNYATQVLLGFKPATSGFEVVKATTSRCRQIVRQLPKSPQNKYRCVQNYCENFTAPRAPPTMLKEVYVAISISLVSMLQQITSFSIETSNFHTTLITFIVQY